MQIRQVGAELFYANGQTEIWKDGYTDVTELMVAFRSFENATKEDCHTITTTNTTTTAVTTNRM